MNKIEKYFINLKLLNNKEVSILTIEDNVWLDNISNILSNHFGSKIHRFLTGNH